MRSSLVLPTEQEAVRLKQLTIEHAPVYFEAVDANRENLSQFEDPTSEKYPTLASVEQSIANPDNPDKLRFGIWDGDTFVGSANLTPQEDGSAEIGYWTDGRVLRRGYATLAAKAISAFAASNYSKVFAEVMEGNDASASVLKKSGFRQVGREGTHLIFNLIANDPERTQNITVRSPKLRDMQDLHELLRIWIRTRDDGSVVGEEVGDVLKSVANSARNIGDRQYVIAEDEIGKVVGIMGTKPPDETMLGFATTVRPIEIINAYVDPLEIGKGIGSALLTMVEQKAAEQGFREIILNSGGRNKHSGWDFWTKRYGKPVAVAKAYYGDGADALVWRKSLLETK